MTIHKEGSATLLLGFVLLFILNAVVFFMFPYLHFPAVGISLMVFGFLISFFRIPDRAVHEINTSNILSPCDGKVVVIEKVTENEFIKEPCMQVSIFMSPLNVHINWYPTSGDVIYSKYHPGKYLVAWHPKASLENERTTVCMDVSGKKILIRQIAGALARRIVCYAKEGDKAAQGHEMGFIKFGSRVDLYLPLDAEIQVKPGEVVTGNRTIIAQLHG
jgi:phosphatidylserine decarboxylase